MLKLAPRPPGWFRAALLRLILCGALFFLVYGACNAFTATRANVGTLLWSWELHIPFIPEFVIPYWSLDLLFCGAFFLCRDRAELNLLTRRICAVILASALCFLFFPLQLGVPRPEPSGWTAPFFRALYFGDQPFNLAPSLHISLRSLLWIVYGAHLTGLIRRVTKCWFFLIGLSTLLIHQHHVIDVAAGFVMAWLITVLFPAQPTRGPRSIRLAAYYGLGAIACLVLSASHLLFLWPTIALTIVALAYATGRPHLLGKENGTLNPAAEWCLLPYLLGAQLIQSRWRRGSLSLTEVAPNLFHSRRPSAREAQTLLVGGPLAVLDLTAEANSAAAFREGAVYHNLPLLDLVEPSEADLAAAYDFIRQQLPHRRVLIHCELGRFRAQRVAAAWQRVALNG